MYYIDGDVTVIFCLVNVEIWNKIWFGDLQVWHSRSILRKIDRLVGPGSFCSQIIQQNQISWMIYQESITLVEFSETYFVSTCRIV